MFRTTLEEAIELLQDFEPTVPCDFEMCSDVAHSYLVCPSSSHAAGVRSVEAMCEGHTADMMESKISNPHMSIHFSKSCFHSSSIIYCAIVSINV